MNVKNKKAVMKCFKKTILRSLMIFALFACGSTKELVFFPSHDLSNGFVAEHLPAFNLEPYMDDLLYSRFVIEGGEPGSLPLKIYTV